MSAPGWYPDPSQQGLMRWWDGSRWSDHSAPAAAPIPVGGTDGLAIAALVTGILTVPIAPIILGHMGRKRIRESGGIKTGDGLAIAGLVLGYIYLAVIVLIIVIGVALAATESSSTSTY